MMLATEPSNSGRKPKPRPSVRSKTPVLGHISKISIARVQNVFQHPIAAVHPRAAHVCARTHTHKRRVSAETVQHPREGLRVHC